MDRSLNNDTSAVLLLCGTLGKEDAAKPLTLEEYNRVARWLGAQELRPANLLDTEVAEATAEGAKIERGRLRALLGRGMQLGFAMEEWERSGLWVISRSDGDYPARYKAQLKGKAPPILFGAGNRVLLQGGGLAIAGSRNVDHLGEAFAREAAMLCAQNGMPVVSGGARGVDQIAANAAFEAGGVSIAVLAENLLRKSLERDTRNALSEERVLLLSPYHPKARFTVGTAMGRNKLIYALADFALVVSAEYNKGGTWAGAEEELKRENRRPVFVRKGENTPKGNIELLKLGALAWPAHPDPSGLADQLQELTGRASQRTSTETLSLFADDNPESDSQVRHVAEPAQVYQSVVETNPSANVRASDAIYCAVLPVLLEHLGEPRTLDGLAATLDVTSAQLTLWLDRAVSEGTILLDGGQYRRA